MNAMNAQRQVRLAIVGAGGITRSMLPELRAKPWLEVVAAVDVRQNALDDLERLAPGIATFTDLDEALAQAQVDAVLVNTPAELHYPQARAAIEAGLDALVAKPMTAEWKDAVALVDLAEERGVTLSVVQQLRFNRHYQAVRRFVESGRLGDVEAVFFQNSKPRPEPANLARMIHPALYEASCHHFDSLFSVLGEPMPTSVSCQEYNPTWSPYAGAGMVNALIEVDNRVHIVYHGGFCAQAPMYDVRFEGTKGVLRCRGLHMSVDTMAYEFADRLGAFEPIQIDEDLPVQGPWQPYLDAWYAYLTGGPEPPFSGRRNLRVLSLIDGAMRSAESGMRIDVAGDQRYASAFSRREESREW
ncbi:Gfo/Idh/MocA family protein [Actinopolymorpha alba]|uniref:Gfo/Idh/MocA family protein n=1 Tax=Actinopolymorpha alba TaxID=533267 RepID=UPI000373812F|nr:Gfo/Idh/MocA family oxidoreductase [Actinopolymorpha alba]